MPSEKEIEAAATALRIGLETAPFIGYDQAARIALTAAEQAREAQPVAWEATTPCYIKYVSDRKYRTFSDETKRWYKPYKCSSCATSPQPDSRLREALEASTEWMIANIREGDVEGCTLISKARAALAQGADDEAV